jgi:catechol 2,3-dioxygenase-like lactoylglutathione lyase family enzyme
MKIHRLDHIHIYAAEPQVSRRFFVDVFEARVLGSAAGSDGGDRYFLKLGGLALVVAPYPAGVEPVIPQVYRDGIFEHGYGIGHFGLHVEDVYEAVDTVRQRGADILSEPREFAGARFAYIGAPDGVIVELLEHREWSKFLGRGSATTNLSQTGSLQE